MNINTEENNNRFTTRARELESLSPADRELRLSAARLVLGEMASAHETAQLSPGFEAKMRENIARELRKMDAAAADGPVAKLLTFADALIARANFAFQQMQLEPCGGTNVTVYDEQNEVVATVSDMGPSLADERLHEVILELRTPNKSVFDAPYTMRLCQDGKPDRYFTSYGMTHEPAFDENGDPVVENGRPIFQGAHLFVIPDAVNALDSDDTTLEASKVGDGDPNDDFEAFRETFTDAASAAQKWLREGASGGSTDVRIPVPPGAELLLDADALVDDYHEGDHVRRHLKAPSGHDTPLPEHWKATVIVKNDLGEHYCAMKPNP